MKRHHLKQVTTFLPRLMTTAYHAFARQFVTDEWYKTLGASCHGARCRSSVFSKNKAHNQMIQPQACLQLSTRLNGTHDSQLTARIFCSIKVCCCFCDNERSSCTDIKSDTAHCYKRTSRAIPRKQAGSTLKGISKFIKVRRRHSVQSAPRPANIRVYDTLHSLLTHNICRWHCWAKKRAILLDATSAAYQLREYKHRESMLRE